MPGFCSRYVLRANWAIVMRLPETVHCPFILVPDRAPIQFNRRIRRFISRVGVDEGEIVKKARNYSSYARMKSAG